MSKLKLLFAAAIALVAISAFASTASAFRATVERGGAISSASLGKVTFEGGVAIECNLTLNGTLASSVELTSGSQIGSVTEVRIAECEGGAVERVLSLPWRMTINSILGTLPDNATGLLFNIVNASFNLSVFGGFISCLYAGNAGALLAVTDTGTNTYSTALITALESIALPKRGGSAFCPASGTFAGTFGLEPLQTLTVS